MPNPNVGKSSAKTLDGWLPGTQRRAVLDEKGQWPQWQRRGRTGDLFELPSSRQPPDSVVITAKDSLSPRFVPLYPTQVMSSVGDVAIFLLLTWLKPRLGRRGQLFYVMLVVYGLFRFAIEFLKPGHPVFYGFTAIQLAAELGVLYYWKVWTEPKSLLVQTAPEEVIVPEVAPHEP